MTAPPEKRYRFTGPPGRPAAYMLALRDGQARYRNDAGSTPESTLDPAREGTYAVLSWDVPTAWYRLAQDGGSPVIQKLGDSSDPATAGIALRLTPIGPGLYMSSMGEVLDLRSPAPTYANVTLIKTDKAPDTTSPAAANDQARPHGEAGRT